MKARPTEMKSNNLKRSLCLVAVAAAIIFGSTQLFRNRASHDDLKKDEKTLVKSDKEEVLGSGIKESKSVGLATSPKDGAPKDGAKEISQNALPGTEATADAPGQAVEKIPTTGCGKITYRQKVKKSELSGDEDPSEQKNLISFRESNVETKNICVRMEGMPIPFQRKKETITFGAVSSTTSGVTIEFCRGKSQCNIQCPIKQDSFADALGVGNSRDAADANEGIKDETSEKRAPAGSWGKRGEDSASVSSIEKEIQDELSISTEVIINKDWAIISRSDLTECKE